jgi:hypothetical protein
MFVGRIDLFVRGSETARSGILGSRQHHQS